MKGRLSPKFYICFLFFAFLLVFLSLPFISALDLKVSPSELSFEGNVSNYICRNISVYSLNYSGIINVSDRWSRSSGKSMESYNLLASEFGVVRSYLDSFQLNKNRTILVCLTFANGGNYNGVLLVKPEDIGFGIGIWIRAEIAGTGSFLSRMENSIISLKNSASGVSGLVLFLVGESVLLLLCLVILLFFNRRRLRSKFG